MRKLVIAIVILAVLAAAVWIYLVSTTPSQSRGVTFPLSDAQRALLAQVPESAESFVLVPGAAALHAKLEANPVTRDLLARASVPRPWVLGGADVIAWSANKKTTYLVHLDPLRAFIARIVGQSESVLINAPPDDPIDRAELERIVSIANGLPNGDALAVQRTSSRGLYWLEPLLEVDSPQGRIGFGPLGAAALRLFVRRDLERIFDFRRTAIAGLVSSDARPAPAT